MWPNVDFLLWYILLYHKGGEGNIVLLYVYCLCVLSDSAIPLVPCRGRLCVEKRGHELVLRPNLMAMVGTSMLYLKWVLGTFTNNIVLFPPTQACSLSTVSKGVY